MKSLVRTAVGGFTIQNALKLSEIEELVRENKIEAYVQPVDYIFRMYDKVIVDREYNKLIYNGNLFRKEHLQLPEYELSTELIRVYDADEVFIGIYRYEKDDNIFKPYKMFLN